MVLVAYSTVCAAGVAPAPTPVSKRTRTPAAVRAVTPSSVPSRKATRTPTPGVIQTRKDRKIPTPLGVRTHRRPSPTPTATLTVPARKTSRNLSKTRKGVKPRPVRFQFSAGGGLSFPASDRFDSKGGPLIRGGLEVFTCPFWTLGIRGQAEEFEWTVPDATDPVRPDAYRGARLYSAAAISRILFARHGTKPYLLGGVGVFKTDARDGDLAAIYPHKGPFYPAAGGLEFEITPQWTLAMELSFLFLEDRASGRVTQVTGVGLNMAFGVD